MCDNAIKSIGNSIREVSGKIADAVAPIDPLGSAVIKRTDEQTKHWDDTGTTKYIGAAAAAYFTAGASLAASSGTAASAGAAGGGAAGAAGAGAATAAGSAAGTGFSVGSVVGAVKTGAGIVSAVATADKLINGPKPVVPTAGFNPGSVVGSNSVPMVLPEKTPTVVVAKPASTGTGAAVVAQSENEMTGLLPLALAGLALYVAKG